MPIKEKLKDDFGIIICGGILIIWGGIVSGLPDSHIYSSFGLHESSNSIYPLNQMDIKSWMERMVDEIVIAIVLFAVNYLISAGGILIATLGGLMSVRDIAKTVKN